MCSLNINSYLNFLLRLLRLKEVEMQLNLLFCLIAFLCRIHLSKINWKEQTQSTIDDLQQLIDDIENNRFPKNIADAIKKFIVDNFYDIVGDMTKMVWFGLTDSGYFVAYIPQSWRDIVFKTTGYDITLDLMPEYGHLVLQAYYV